MKGSLAPGSRAALRRFWRKVERMPSGCWHWTGFRGHNGYGFVRVRRRVMTAHRVSYELAHGVELPPELHVRHQCDNPPCVNPRHLAPGTAAENTADQIARGRAWYQPRKRGAGQGRKRLALGSPA